MMIRSAVLKGVLLLSIHKPFGFPACYFPEVLPAPIACPAIGMSGQHRKKREKLR